MHELINVHAPLFGRGEYAYMYLHLSVIPKVTKFSKSYKHEVICRFSAHDYLGSNMGMWL